MQKLSKRMKLNLWLVWLVLWPISLWFSYTYYYINISGEAWNIILFALLMGAVALFPMTVNQQNVFFVNGVSLVVFILFGLFVEIVLSSLTLLIVLARVGTGKKDIYRIPLNIILITIGSIGAATVYNLLGGTHMAQSLGAFQEWTAIFGYAITVFVLNQVLISILDLVVLKQKRKIFDDGMRWESVYSLLYIPIGLIIYIMYVEIGWIAIPLVGIPYTFISVIFLLLYSYYHVNDLLEKTGDIGHRLTKRLDTNAVYDVFVQEMKELLPIDHACIYQVTDEKHLKRIRYYQDNTAIPLEISKDVFSEEVLKTGDSLLFKSKKEWTKSYPKADTSLPIESVLAVPVLYDDAIVGIVTVFSAKPKTFETLHKRILDILNNYLGVAAENAQSYNKKKQLSERDGLTGLYNYRHFSNQLSQYAVKVDPNTTCSLLVLDLDHFKPINDQFGHEAGNDILQQLARIMEAFIGKDGLVARYGGEEFVVFMPETSLEQARDQADRLRMLIANTVFVMTNHILNDSGPLKIQVTVSIGVAAFPDHCDDLTTLVRFADSALYTGAKETGRNKIAVFQQLQPV
ncbi:Adenylate cyclase [Lentibacillus sp. JNUCC-1]|uniref:sensor domain-containing diguanylate cyclase n=1 Tax=Lentibacillus sp. JNUCC-1 TaxID=2654513 RepID=UPI0012E94B15|nr:sensor domain-containing diguanylate cyclase [Lentibacillus sp. JNUCC-1]MUV39428.1 Adenylate cyclase [Lentibacillus sp. JNUCC-1]